MRKPALPHESFIFVGDGRKALFLRNAGDEKFANFVTERVIVDENPSTREQGSDKPGRSLGGAEGTRRGGLEPTDWHDIEEHRFAHRVAIALETLVRDRDAPALAIIAPPRALADIRAALHADVKARVVLEMHKDLTRMPVWEIERHVMTEMKAA